jgi:hypothetical protein
VVFSLKEARGILMKKLVFALILFALTSGVNALAQGTDPAITATRVFGKITEINAPAGEVIVKTDAGSLVSVKLSEKTSYERMPPGETDRTKAVTIGLTDIAVGDGIYVKGYVAEDRKSVPAQKVTVVSQSDIAKKQEKERLEWKQRGISGIIESLNPQTKEITVTTRAAEGPKPVILPVTDKVKMRRYAPDSIKFSEAKKSSWEDLKVGDQLRAKGERSADGARFTPEEVVTGSFRTIGGAITAIDPATGEIKLSDIQSKQPLTVVVRKDSMLKRVPPEFMQMMAAGGAGGPGAGGPAPAGSAAPQGGGARPPAGGAPAGGAAGPQGGPGGAAGGGFDIQRMIDNLPATTLAELKPGEMVLLLSTAGADPTRVTAITLVSGVQPIFTMLQAKQGGPANRPPNLGTINLGIGGP